jgi:TetR/AcrR family transcriptional regulator, regulator of cefoperazone and chloramphenicol sensitivity
MTSPPHTASRTDGAEARQKILLCALKLFAEKGYAKTSVRQIAQAAQANVSAISYYFTDKAGLYRTVFSWPSLIARPCEYRFTAPELPLKDALQQFYMEFFHPLKMGEVVQDVMKLRYREMLEPTGVWEEAIESEIKPHHAAMTELLCRHLDVHEPDDDIQSLVLGCIGMAVHLYMGQKIIRTMTPQLVKDHAALDRMAERYGRYARAMVLDEKIRRTGIQETSA